VCQPGHGVAGGTAAEERERPPGVYWSGKRWFLRREDADDQGALKMLALADGAIGIHLADIVLIAVPVLIILGVVAFLRGVRRGMRRD
jgi:hypothetical protein